MANEPRPCPFCEGEGEGDSVQVLDRVIFRVICAECHAKGAGALTIERAIVAWNRRAAPPAADAQRARELADAIEATLASFLGFGGGPILTLAEQAQEVAALLRRLAGGTDGR